MLTYHSKLKPACIPARIIISNVFVMLLIIVSRPVYAGELNGNTVLINAVRLNDVLKVRQLLEHGADPNLENSYGATALFFIDGKGGNAKSRKESAKILSLLLSHGADVNAQSKNGATGLLIAAEKGSLEIVTTLLAAKANPNLQTTHGDTALSAATMHGFTKIVLSLLIAGANPNTKDVNGQTPLMIAINQAPRLSTTQSPYEVILLALLSNGANPNVKDRNGESPVTLVATGDKNVLIYPLLDHHANINVTDPLAAGATPIIIAARHGNTPLIKALLRAHPDLTHRDRFNKTALDYAREKHFNKIVILLSQGRGRD